MSEEAYERLKAAAESGGTARGSAALEWFLADQPAGQLDVQGLEDRMAALRSDWDER